MIVLDDPRRLQNFDLVKINVPHVQKFSAFDTRKTSTLLDKVNGITNRDQFMSDATLSYLLKVDPSRIGCHFSHAMLWKKILDEYDPKTSDIFWLMEDDIYSEPQMMSKVTKVLSLPFIKKSINEPLFIRFFAHPTRDNTQFIDSKKIQDTDELFWDNNTGFVSYCTNYKGLQRLFQCAKDLHYIDVIRNITGIKRIIPSLSFTHDTRSTGTRKDSIDMPGTRKLIKDDKKITIH